MPKEPEVTLMRLLLHFFETGMHYIGYFILALLGGFVSYLDKVRNGEETKFRWFNLTVDVLGSGFTGLMVALLAIEMNLSIELTFFLVGVSGHMGVRALFLLRTKLIEYLGIRGK